jgi:hypothetical protein
MAAVKKLARMMDWRVYHTLRSEGSDAGWPDLFMQRGREIVIAELKREKGHLTPLQADWLWALAFAGLRVYVWRPSSWPQIEAVLR